MKDIEAPLLKSLTYRLEPVASDAVAIRRIVESTDFFNAEEREIAIELISERLLQGEKSGYHFIFAVIDDRVAGYCCFGPIMGTCASYDLYWLAVDNDYRGAGIGRELLAKGEQLIASRGGERIYAETASRARYAPTPAFYLARGYREDAHLADFYSPGDGKIIYVKVLIKSPNDGSILTTS